jgi:hypothetical protein
MVMKDLAHKVTVEEWISPISCAAKANFDTAAGATPIDTLGCESVMFILQAKAGGGNPNGVFTLAASAATIAADAGTAQTSSADVQIHRDDGLDTTGITISATNVLTYAADAAADAHAVILQYTGPLRYVRLNCTSSTNTTVFAVTVIKSHLRREPLVV